MRHNQDTRLNLQSRGALTKVGANSSTSQLREGTSLLSSSRRTFLQSVSKSAAVLSLEGVLARSRPLQAFFPAGDEPPKSGASLGLSFINVAKESGLNIKTIYGGEHKNKYLLETTGCGVAFYDYDNDGWLDIFLVNGWRWRGSLPARSRLLICTKTIATAPSPMLLPRLA